MCYSLCADETAHAPPPSRAAARAAAPSPAPPAHAVTPSPCALCEARTPAQCRSPATFASRSAARTRFGSAPCARRRHTPRPCRRGAPGPPPYPCVPYRSPRLPAAGRRGGARETPPPPPSSPTHPRQTQAAPVIVGGVRVGVGREQRGDYLDVPCCCRRHQRRGAAAHTTQHKRDGVEQPNHSTLVGPRPYPPASLASTLAFAPMSISTARLWPNLAAHTSAVHLPTSDLRRQPAPPRTHAQLLEPVVASRAEHYPRSLVVHTSAPAAISAAAAAKGRARPPRISARRPCAGGPLASADRFGQRVCGRC